MAIDHKNIPDAELHDPKGYAAANNNTMLKKNSGGSLEWSFVDTENIATDAVTNAKIATNAVNSDSISNGSVVEAKLTSNSVTASKLNPQVSAGSTIVFQSDGEHSQVGDTYTDTSGIAIGPFYGTARVSAQVRDDSATGSSTSSVRVSVTHLDGSSDIFGTVTSANNNYQSTTVDIPIKYGDVVSIQQKANGPDQTSYTRNRRISFTENNTLFNGCHTFGNAPF